MKSVSGEIRIVRNLAVFPDRDRSAPPGRTGAGRLYFRDGGEQNETVHGCPSSSTSAIFSRRRSRSSARAEQSYLLSRDETLPAETYLESDGAVEADQPSPSSWETFVGEDENDFGGFVSWQLLPFAELAVNAGKHDFVLVRLMFSYALERG
jgi:hypothetical protein